jgi:hypothetical protein
LIRLLAALSAATLLATPVGAFAKGKKTGAAAEARKKKKEDESPPPNDKRTNEGAQGRLNATEDAAASAESPINERRP